MDVASQALLHGLPGEEASRRLCEEGYNELPATKSRSVFAIAFEAEPAEADVMRRPPRRPEEPLFGRRSVAVSLLQGISIMVILLAIYLATLYRGQGETEARTLAFTTLIVANFGLIFTNRSWSRTILDTVGRHNPALWWVTRGAIAFLALVLSVPVLRSLFHFAPLHIVDLAPCFAGGVVSILWFEGLKVYEGDGNGPLECSRENPAESEPACGVRLAPVQSSHVSVRMDAPLHCLGSGLYCFPRRSFPIQRPEILEKPSPGGGLPDRTVEIPQVQVEGRLIEELAGRTR